MNYVYFSASGTTQKVISILSDAMGNPSVSYDLLRCPPTEQVTFASDETAVFAFPVCEPFSRWLQSCEPSFVHCRCPRVIERLFVIV